MKNQLIACAAVICFIQGFPVYAAAPEQRISATEEHLQRKCASDLPRSTLSFRIGTLLYNLAGVDYVLELKDGEDTVNDVFVPAISAGVTFKEALDSIVEAADYEYIIQDEVVYVFPKGKYAKKISSSAAALDKAGQEAFAKELAALGDDDFNERERASRAIKALGPRVVPAIQKALKVQADPEIRVRLGKILEKLSQAGDQLDPEIAKNTDTPYSFGEVIGESLEELCASMNRINPGCPFKLACDEDVAGRKATIALHKNVKANRVIECIARATNTRAILTDDVITLVRQDAKRDE